MPTELNTNENANDMTKKLWERHQGDEFTKVSNYKEAVCLGCMKVDVAAATIADICGDCAGKKGRETILVPIKEIVYGLCHFCGEFKHGLEQINARLCQKCHRRVSNHMKSYNLKGGMLETDPFWKSQRRKHGKDWAHIMSKDLGNPR